MDFSHVGLYTNDIYRLTYFYKMAFGFKEDYSYVSRNTPGLKTVLLTSGHSTIELLSAPSKSIPPDRASHISFEADDVAAEYDRLMKIGIKISKPPRETGDGYLEMELTDPDGNIIEISKRIKAFTGYPVKAVIFDFDGTVIDSEDNYYEADRILLAGCGIDFTQKMKEKYIGTGNHAMMTDLKERYNLRESIDELLIKKNRLYLDIALNNTRIYPEMLALMDKLLDAGYPMALASGSSPEILKALCDKLGLNKYFTRIISAEDVGRSKPEPDIFLHTAQLLATPPENCVVLEDSKYGVEAAKRAFMKCIAIPYLTEKPLDFTFYMADLLFENGMNTFQPDKAFEWIRG